MLCAESSVKYFAPLLICVLSFVSSIFESMMKVVEESLEETIFFINICIFFFIILQILVLCAKSSVKYFAQLLICVLSFVGIFGSLMYVVEIVSGGNVDPVTFPSIPHAMWWAIITMTTVGYG